jgi:hypothetical protein
MAWFRSGNVETARGVNRIWTRGIHTIVQTILTSLDGAFDAPEDAAMAGGGRDGQTTRWIERVSNASSAFVAGACYGTVWATARE